MFSFVCILILVVASLANHGFAAPRVTDPDLQIQTVTAGLLKPTSMAFLGEDDFMVLEQEEGRVYRIKDGIFLPEPVLKVNVNSTGFGKGLLGIDIAKVSDTKYYLFVYFTEAQSVDNKTAIGNRLYRYTFIDDPSSGPLQGRIVDSKMLLDLPVDPGMTHNGGKVRIGANGSLNLITGDFNHRDGKAQNIQEGPDLDGTGGILNINQDGANVREGIFGITQPADKYIAYGIRNSFGMDFDPLTGDLWITENGPTSDDEINLAEVGFNSGWRLIMGMAPAEFNFSSLVSFGGKGNYSDPEFVWKRSVGPVAIEFLRSAELGEEYQNDMFVSDNNWGRIYKFDLNSERSGLLLEGNLTDKVADSDRENKGVIFAEGLRGATDLKTGPGDGYLYVLSHYDGAVYKIMPKDELTSRNANFSAGNDTKLVQ